MAGSPRLERGRASGEPRGLAIPFVSTHIAGRIIAPHLVIIVAISLLAIFITVRIVTDSLNTKFVERLQNAAHAANGHLLREERDLRRAAAAVAGIPGVAAALAGDAGAVGSTDLASLRTMLDAVQAGTRVELLDVVSRDRAVLSLRDETASGNPRPLDDRAASWPIVRQALALPPGPIEGLPSELVSAPWGATLYVAAPVRFPVDGAAAGVVLAGVPLDRLFARVGTDVQTSLTLYGAGGEVVISTLASAGGDPPALPLSSRAGQAPLAGPPSVLRPLRFAGQACGLAGSPAACTYTELAGPAELRALPGSWLGLSTPNVFIQSAGVLSRVQVLALFGVVMVVAITAGMLAARAITRPIRVLSRAHTRVQGGDLLVQVPVTTRDEVGTLTRSFNQMVADLRRGREAEALARTLQEQELDQARLVQERLLPATLPAWPGRLQIAARLRPALETSGDFYDVVPVGPGGGTEGDGAFVPLQIAVADVQGKGLGAALIAVQAHTVLRASARLQHLPGAASPAEALRHAGRVHHESHGAQDFVTCALAVVEPNTVAHPAGTSVTSASGGARLRLSNAAQVPPLLCRAGHATELKPPGDRLPLGILPDPTYQDLTVDLAPGDVVVFASDGLPEAPAALNGELFGFTRLAASAAHWAACAADAEEVLAGIWSDLTSWCGPESHHDDMTLLVLRVPAVTTLAGLTPSRPRVGSADQCAGTSSACSV